MSVVLTGVVHSCSGNMIPVPVTVNGQDVVAYVSGLTIEVAGESRTWTIDVAGGNEGAAQDTFPVGTNVTITLDVA